MARLTDEAGMSLDFVDRDHVLVTFNPKKLFTRLSNCPPGHADRLVHAAILEVPSGKIVRETDWYLHDHRRYIWPLGSGKFLLRKWNSLFLVDSTLKEKLLLESPRNLLWVSVTPDKKQIIVGTAENKDAANNPSREPAESKNKQEFQLEFLDLNSLAAQRTVKLNKIVELDGTSAGYADSIHKGDLYLIRFGPTPDQRQNIARVRSRCVPEVVYPSDNSLLIGRCPLTGNEYIVSAFTVPGRRLWRQDWSELRYFPAIARNQDDSRVAVSTVIRSADPITETKAGDESEIDNDINHGLEQNIQVFETASGKAIRSVNVNPVVMSGQNFSLSPDGRRLAVLHDSGVQFYDLPPISDEERAKFTALKADVPGLYMVSSKTGADVLLDPEPGDESSTPETAALSGNASPSGAQQNQATSEVSERRSDAATLPPPVAPAASSEATGAPVTTFKASTQAVVVDVVVTDNKNHPVHGLRQQDFQIIEDGKPQNARYFHEVGGVEGVASPDLKPPVQPASAANVFSNNTHAPEPGSVTLVLLDLLNTPSADQQHAREQLIKFLKTKPSSFQFGLSTLSSDRASHLRLIQGFTADENLLLSAINGKNAVPQAVRWQVAAAGTENSVGTVRQAAQEGPMGGWTALLHGLETMQAEQQVTDTDTRVGITIDALMQLARYLAGIPGRKNLVWLSGSFPIALFSNTDINSPGSDNRNYGNRFKQATNLLAEAQVAVYPVDVRGLIADDVTSAESMGRGARDVV